jgi:hypothetical protein
MSVELCVLVSYKSTKKTQGGRKEDRKKEWKQERNKEWKKEKCERRNN